MRNMQLFIVAADLPTSSSRTSIVEEPASSSAELGGCFELVEGDAAEQEWTPCAKKKKKGRVYSKHGDTQQPTPQQQPLPQQLQQRLIGSKRMQQLQQQQRLPAVQASPAPANSAVQARSLPVRFHPLDLSQKDAEATVRAEFGKHGRVVLLAALGRAAAISQLASLASLLSYPSYEIFVLEGLVRHFTSLGSFVRGGSMAAWVTTLHFFVTAVPRPSPQQQPQQLQQQQRRPPQRLAPEWVHIGAVSSWADASSDDEA
jgi:hypothetical protein